jgi:hypothetical protein
VVLSRVIDLSPNLSPKRLDIAVTFTYRISYDKENEKHDNVNRIRGKKTALQSG